MSKITCVETTASVRGRTIHQRVSDPRGISVVHRERIMGQALIAFPNCSVKTHS